MTTSRHVFNTLIVLIASAMLSPCLASGPGIKDAPQWVNTGTTYETMQGTRYFHGVGLAPTMGDRALQQASAERRARSELQRILSTYLNDLASQYKTTSADTASTPEDKATEQLTRLGKPALQAAKTVARWRDPRTGTLYILLQLDLNEVKRIAENNAEISPATRQFMQEYADIVFDSESQYVEY